MPEHARDVLKRIGDAGLRSPKRLTISITNGCNLQCEHCWVESPSEAVPVPTEVVKRLIREFAELGGVRVCLTGGEPLTHPRWRELLAHAGRIRQFQDVRVQTNGTLFTTGAVRSLRGLHLGRLTLQVSLEGASPQTHDRVRGQGGFQRVLEGLQRVADAGLGSRTSIAFTEMRHNVHELPDVLALAERLGLAAVSSASLVRCGRAQGTNRVLQPEPEQYAELLDRYHADPEFRRRADRFGQITALAWWEGRAHPRTEACTFIENPYVTADGRMYPCVLFHADDFAARGLHELPLAEAIRDALPLWVKAREVSRRRLGTLTECRDCPSALSCAGGCMGRAYADGGDPMAVEDRCALRRAVRARDRDGEATR